MSPSVRFLHFLNHFCLIWSWGKYSLDHCLQKMFERYWTCFHLRREKGVKASKSRWSVETVVSGQPFIILSPSHIRVDKLSSSIVCIWSRAWSIFCAVQMQHSHTPPKCEPLGAGFVRVLKTLEFQEANFKALKVLEFRFRSLKVLDFLLKKIEKYLLLAL